MEFVRSKNGWDLVESTSKKRLATLKSLVQVLALKRFSEFYAVAGFDAVPEKFSIEHSGQTYIVIPLGHVGESLTLVLIDQKGYSEKIETSLILS